MFQWVKGLTILKPDPQKPHGRRKENQLPKNQPSSGLHKQSVTHRQDRQTHHLKVWCQAKLYEENFLFKMKGQGKSTIHPALYPKIDRQTDFPSIGKNHKNKKNWESYAPRFSQLKKNFCPEGPCGHYYCPNGCLPFGVQMSWALLNNLPFLHNQPPQNQDLRSPKCQ